MNFHHFDPNSVLDDDFLLTGAAGGGGGSGGNNADDDDEELMAELLALEEGGEEGPSMGKAKQPQRSKSFATAKPATATTSRRTGAMAKGMGGKPSHPPPPLPTSKAVGGRGVDIDFEALHKEIGLAGVVVEDDIGELSDDADMGEDDELLLAELDGLIDDGNDDSEDTPGPGTTTATVSDKRRSVPLHAAQAAWETPEAPAEGRPQKTREGAPTTMTVGPGEKQMPTTGGPPAIPARTTSVTAPSLPAPTSSTDAPPPMQLPPQLPQRNTASAAAAPPNSSPTTSSEPALINSKAEGILLHRRELYLKCALAAKEADDRAKAAEYLAVVKLFQQALEMMRSGEQKLTEEDLEQIPPSPPPYRKAGDTPPMTLIGELNVRLAKFEELSREAEQSGNTAKAKFNGRMAQRYKEVTRQVRVAESKGLVVPAESISSLPNPPGFEAIPPEVYGGQAMPPPSSTASSLVVPPLASSSAISKPGATTSATSIAAINRQQPRGRSLPASQQSSPSQLQLLLQRQLELKKAAIAARDRGDIPKAKELLQKAHELDTQLEAAKRARVTGDVGAVATASRQAMAGGEAGPSTMAIMNQQRRMSPAMGKIGAHPLHSKLRGELQKQVEICQKSLELFKRINHAGHTSFYQQLLASTNQDLQQLQSQAAGGGEPKFRLVDVELPTVERNEELAENVLELRFPRIEHLQLQAGWEPHHLATYVAYNFPYPSEQHQEGKTQVAKNGGVDPTFADVATLNIQRKSAQLARVCRNRSMKVEVYQRGGLFRSDKLWYHANLPLAELLTKATVVHRVNLLEGRRATTGHITVEFKQHRPLDEGKAEGVLVPRKWVKLI